MKADRLGDLRAEMLRQPRGTQGFMVGVDAGISDILRQLMEHMADIVEKRGGDQRRRGPVPLGKGAALQGVIELAYPLAIAFMATFRKGGADFFENANAARSVPPSSFRRRASRRLSMPSRSI